MLNIQKATMSRICKNKTKKSHNADKIAIITNKGNEKLGKSYSITELNNERTESLRIYIKIIYKPSDDHQWRGGL